MATGTELRKFTPTKEKSVKLAAKFRNVFKFDKLRFKALPGLTTNWGPEKLVMLYQFASDEGATQQEFADALGVDRSGISRKCNAMDWPLFEQTLEKLVDMTFEEAIKIEAKTHQKKIEAKTEVKQRSILISRESFFADLGKQILLAHKTVEVKPLPQTVLTRTPKNQRTPEHIVLLLSDLHVGQEFNSDETGGINSYNEEIFRRRAINLQKALIDIFDIHSQAYRIPELHIFALGDMVQGGNLNGEWGAASTSNLHVAKQATIAAKTIASMINDWSRYFSKINFTGVIGNHGRAGVTKNSDKIGANWDNITYAQLAAQFDGNPKVNIHYSDTWWIQKEVLGTHFILVHGDYCNNNINSLITLDQKMRSITASVKDLPPFNILCLGHFHTNTSQETPMGRVIVNGSFPGADMHSLQHMRTGSQPTQRIFGVHPEVGITWEYWLNLEKTRK